jgi:hypothetical protein
MKQAIRERILSKTETFTILGLINHAELTTSYQGRRESSKIKREVLDDLLAEGLIELVSAGAPIPQGGGECSGRQREFRVCAKRLGVYRAQNPLRVVTATFLCGHQIHRPLISTYDRSVIRESLCSECSAQAEAEQKRYTQLRRAVLEKYDGETSLIDAVLAVASEADRVPVFLQSRPGWIDKQRRSIYAAFRAQGIEKPGNFPDASLAIAALEEQADKQYADLLVVTGAV